MLDTTVVLQKLIDYGYENTMKVAWCLRRLDRGNGLTKSPLYRQRAFAHI